MMSVPPAWWWRLRSGVEVAVELVDAAGAAQLGQRLGLDLADPLAGQAEDHPDLLEGARRLAGEPEPVLDHRSLALVEPLHDRGDIRTEQQACRGLDGLDRGDVLEQIGHGRV